MRDFRRASDRLNALQKSFADEDYQQMREDYKALLQIPAFRRVFAGIVKRGRVFASIAFDSNETNEVMKNIGWRELAVDIYFTANAADGEMVLKAIKERNDLEKDRKARVDKELNETKGNEQ